MVIRVPRKTACLRGYQRRPRGSTRALFISLDNQTGSYCLLALSSLMNQLQDISALT